MRVRPSPVGTIYFSTTRLITSLPPQPLLPFTSLRHPFMPLSPSPLPLYSLSFGQQALNGTAMRDCDEAVWKTLIPAGTLASRTRALEAESKTSDFLADTDVTRSSIMAKYAETKAEASREELRAHRNIKALEKKYDEQVRAWAGWVGRCMDGWVHP